MPRRAPLSSGLVLAFVVASASAAADPPPYARRRSFVVGSDTTLLAATDVPRNEPYYAYRNERRNILSLRAVLDVFPFDRFSIGAAATLAHERSDGADPATTVALAARAGIVLGGRTFALWPGFSAGVHHRGTTTPVVSADLRAVFSLTETILFTVGPRLDLEIGRPDRERTASLVVGLAGAARTDEFAEHRDRGQFGKRGMHVVDAQFAASSRATPGSKFALASTRATVGLDGFLWPGASIGTYVGVHSHNTGAARLNAFVAGARIGQAIIFSDRLWWWARFGVEAARADAAGSSPRSVFQIVIDAPFVAAIAEGVAISFGPWLAMPVVGAHVRTTSVGGASSMVFYFR